MGSVDDKKLLVTLMFFQSTLVVLVLTAYLFGSALIVSVTQLAEPAFPYLETFQKLEEEHEIPVCELMAFFVVCYYTDNDFNFADFSQSFLSEIASGVSFEEILKNKLKKEDLEGQFQLVKLILKYTLNYLISFNDSYSFPILGDKYNYVNGWHNTRTYGGNRQHLGIDIICPYGTPIISVCDGRVLRIGWNELGGWRIGVQGLDGNYYYYGHLSRYASNMEVNKQVCKGEIIGYVGDSGYGPEGTTGKFVPHLHFGVYQNGVAINPFKLLQMWESRTRV